MKKRVLITGFEPFAHHKTNPTQALCESLKGFSSPEAQITVQIWPVAFSQIKGLLGSVVRRDFDVIIHFGLAASRKTITPERFAYNEIHCPERADNEGLTLSHQIICQDAPHRIHTTLPVERVAQSCEGKVSEDPGRFVCNYTMYHSLQMIQRLKKKTLSGFIHVPQSEDIEGLKEKTLRIIKVCLA